jgi:hypothetical protein
MGTLLRMTKGVYGGCCGLFVYLCFVVCAGGDGIKLYYFTD